MLKLSWRRWRWAIVAASVAAAAVVAAATVPDPRDPRGIRHPLIVVLAIAACAIAAGEKTFAEIAEWGQAADQDVLAAVGARIAPC